MKFIKKANFSKESSQSVLDVVCDIASSVQKKGDEAVRSYSKKLDNWSPDSFRLSPDEIKNCLKDLTAKEISDIEYAQNRVRKFAQKQKECLKDLEYEISKDIILGHKNIPIDAVLCYVPAGAYPMVASAHMGVVTAKVAGVNRIVATCPPNKGKINSYVISAMHLGGADEIYTLGGVQALAAFVYGTKTIAPVSMLVGPGNAYIAEAKKYFFGKVGIDLPAGPTETLVVADDSVDGEICAVDLLGQAEHGPTSPAVLLTTSEKLAKDCLSQIAELLPQMPTKEIAAQAWENYGEIILAANEEEMLKIADELAFEHVQIMTKEPDYFLKNMKNYGALFLGPRTNVAYGDKVIGTNHTLPTSQAAKYTGGLWVGKFLKTCTYQKILSDAASGEIGEYCSRLCMMEGFSGHAEQANVRVRRYGNKSVLRYKSA
jgi:sulfopropanediol 3-dehydrogenase